MKKKMNEFNFLNCGLLGNKLFTKKKLGRIFNCILMICNLAKKKGDVTFRLAFLNGTLFRYVYLHACTRPGH